MSTLATRLAAVDEQIAQAARSAGRSPGEITRIVVTKFHPASVVRDLAALGVSDVGENRQQEFGAKAAELSDLTEVSWHFIGQLQSNKAAAIRRDAGVVHSVDRAKIVTALDRAATDDSKLDVLLQVNLTADDGRGGVAPSELRALAEQVAAAETLRLRGVMGVAPLDEDARPSFERLARCLEDVRSVDRSATWMSAGMSGDLADAIASGATHLRIGTAITGPRPERDYPQNRRDNTGGQHGESA